MIALARRHIPGCVAQVSDTASSLASTRRPEPSPIMRLQRSSTQRSPGAHRFRFAVSATHSPSPSVHTAVDAERGKMNVGRLTNKRDSTVLKEMLFDPPSGLVLTDRYVCVMFARPCLLYPRSSLLVCFASPVFVWSRASPPDERHKVNWCAPGSRPGERATRRKIAWGVPQVS